MPSPTELWRKSVDARKMSANMVQQAVDEDREPTEDELALIASNRADAEKYERMAKLAEEQNAALTSTLSLGDQFSTRHSQPIDLGAKFEPGKTQDEKEYSFGDFLRCIDRIGDRNTSRRDYERSQNRLHNLYGSNYRSWENGERRDLVQATGTAGGYLTPTPLYNQIMEVAAEMSVVRPYAMKVPMGADTIEIPILNQTTAPTSGNTSFFGGITATWGGESAEATETEPGFRQAKLTAHELNGYTEVGRTLMSNSAVSIDALLYRLFGGAVAWYEDTAFINGDGGNQPLGILKADCTIASGTARGSASAITLANATQVYAKVLASCRAKGRWWVSQGAITAFLQMAGVTNGVILPAGFYTPDGAANAPSMMLLGRPVHFTEKLPTLNASGDFMFVDLSQYIIGERGGLEIAISNDYKFRNNQTCFRFIHRVAGMPWLNNYVTLADTSTTNSCFVYLQAQ
jgi:HK97 family phage major capsid protein